MFCGKYVRRIEALEQDLSVRRAIRDALDKSTAIVELGIDGSILVVNQNFCDVLGYRQDELLGMHHRTLCDRSYAESGEYQVFWNRLRKGEFCQGKIRRLCKDGRSVWLEATYSPVRGADGRVERVIKLASDITRRVEEAACSTAMVQAVERAMAVIEFDLEGIVLRANGNFLATMGYTERDVLGQHHRIFCTPALAGSPEYAKLWQRLRSGELVSGQFERINRRGEPVWLEASYNPVFDPDGCITKVVKFATDITASVEARRAEQQGAETAYRVAMETCHVSEHGAGTILATVEKINAIATLFSAAATQVTDLGERTQAITSIVNTIKEIADQTNLLALNAAIEAARAGETGRGFAVVADEVRKLAERTAASTGEIGQMIRNIQAEASSVAGNMNDGLHAVQAGVALASQAGVSIEQIKADAQRVVQVIEALSAVVGQGAPKH